MHVCHAASADSAAKLEVMMLLLAYTNRTLVASHIMAANGASLFKATQGSRHEHARLCCSMNLSCRPIHTY